MPRLSFFSKAALAIKTAPFYETAVYQGKDQVGACLAAQDKEFILKLSYDRQNAFEMVGGSSVVCQCGIFFCRHMGDCV